MDVTIKERSQEQIITNHKCTKDALFVVMSLISVHCCGCDTILGTYIQLHTFFTDLSLWKFKWSLSRIPGTKYYTWWWWTDEQKTKGRIMPCLNRMFIKWYLAEAIQSFNWREKNPFLKEHRLMKEYRQKGRQVSNSFIVTVSLKANVKINWCSLCIRTTKMNTMVSIVNLDMYFGCKKSK